MNPTQERRYGKITVSRDMVKNRAEYLQAVLSNVVVLQTEYDFISDSTIYKCASSHFDPVPPGDIVPEYIAYLSCKPDSFQLIVWFERIKL